MPIVRVTAKPRVETLVHELSERTRQIVSRRAVQVADGLDPTQYAVEGPADGAVLGEPLVVRFRAPAGHPPDDWAGVYQHRRKMCVIGGAHVRGGGGGNQAPGADMDGHARLGSRR
jgi:hypothetical protein